MSQVAVKFTEKSGLRMAKDRILDIIKKSPSKEFMFSQVPNTKDIVIVVRQMWSLALRGFDSMILQQGRERLLFTANDYLNDFNLWLR